MSTTLQELARGIVVAANRVVTASTEIMSLYRKRAMPGPGVHTCYSCETCHHARTGRFCSNCMQAEFATASRELRELLDEYVLTVRKEAS